MHAVVRSRKAGCPEGQPESTIVSMYLDRGIHALAFVRITGRDDVFAELIGALSEKFGSQRYLKASFFLVSVGCQRGI
jgi:hypothetical protein